MTNGARQYYLAMAPGHWEGTFAVRVSVGALLLARGVPWRGKLKALMLAGASLAAETLRLEADMDCERARGRARAQSTLRFQPIQWAPEIPIWRTVALFQLTEGSNQVDAEFHDELGPVPYLFTSRYRGRVDVRPDGLSATYELPLFGVPWRGEYKILDGQRQVDARYEAEGGWGSIHYTANAGPRRHGDPDPVPADSPAGRVAALAGRLQLRATQLRERDSPFAAFTDVYAQESYGIADALASGTPKFDQPNWVADVAERFGKRYLDSLDGYVDGRGYVEPAWRTVFATLERFRERFTELDALAVMIPTHIAVDLPVVLLETNTTIEHVRDFETVNDLLKLHVDRQQEDLALTYGRVYALLDALGGRFDEALIVHGVRALRTQAWYDFGRLAADTSVEGRLAYDDRVRDLVEDLVSRVLEPGPPPVALAVRAFRRLIRAARRW